jgi:hypothetical protein
MACSCRNRERGYSCWGPFHFKKNLHNSSKSVRVAVTTTNPETRGHRWRRSGLPPPAPPHPLEHRERRTYVFG